MDSFGEVYFVNRPRTIDDLCVPHPVEKRRALKIIKTIRLSAMDYENFIYDMLADRGFIEENYALCSQREIWECIFVCEKTPAKAC